MSECIGNIVWISPFLSLLLLQISGAAGERAGAESDALMKRERKIAVSPLG